MFLKNGQKHSICIFVIITAGLLINLESVGNSITFYKLCSAKFILKHLEEGLNTDFLITLSNYKKLQSRLGQKHTKQNFTEAMATVMKILNQ